MSMHYILENRAIVPVDVVAWAKWFETADRTIALTTGEKFVVSTVFLGLDHRFCDDGPPLVFETMVFKRGVWNTRYMPEEDGERYSTMQEAEAGHQAMVEKWGVTAVAETDPHA